MLILQDVDLRIIKTENYMANMELSEQEIIRRESLAKLRELGIEPYPAPLYPVNTSTK